MHTQTHTYIEPHPYPLPRRHPQNKTFAQAGRGCHTHLHTCLALCLQVVLHPLLVHITLSLAQTLQDYFNLREPEECPPSGPSSHSGAVGAGGAPGTSAAEGAGVCACVVRSCYLTEGSSRIEGVGVGAVAFVCRAVSLF